MRTAATMFTSPSTLLPLRALNFLNPLPAEKDSQRLRKGSLWDPMWLLEGSDLVPFGIRFGSAFYKLVRLSKSRNRLFRKLLWDGHPPSEAPKPSFSRPRSCPLKAE